MNNLNEKIISTKNELMAALGEQSIKYLENMKLWFRHKWSKEDFDRESRKFLTPDKMYLHNQFLLAILNKIDAFQIPNPLSGLGYSSMTSATQSNQSSRKTKKKRTRNYSDRVTFEPYDLLDFMPEDDMKSVKPSVGTDENVKILTTQRYCVQELFLPDSGFILGRFLIGAWEIGIANVEDSVAEYMSAAIQVLLKNLISTVIMKKKHYKVTGEGSFYYDVGSSLKDPSIRNSVTRQKLDDCPLELDKEITSPNFMRRFNEDSAFLSACEVVHPSPMTQITLNDCQRAFSDSNIILSHTVFSLNMERLNQMMH